MLLQSDKFREICQKATVYLDTNIFIHAFDQDALKVLFGELASDYETAFVTLSSVEYEFTRGSRSIEELQVRREFVRDIVYRVMPVGKFLESDKHDAFSAIMSIILGKKNSQYTDYLLAMALYAYSHVDDQFVLSADTKAFPSQLFTVVGVITAMSSQGEMVHLHLVKLDRGKYLNLLQSVR